jgi:CDP-diacylglycerol---glycerol-3-phosphate 3-phosphatidyltransferase
LNRMLNRGSNLNLPNVLTTFRFLVIPVVVVLMKSQSVVINLVAAVLFLVASLTDIVDGYIARKYNIVTNMGKILDPLADKLMVLIVLIMLIPMGRVPDWVVALIVLRETAVTSLRAVAAADGVVISASPLGKFKNMFQVIFTLFLIMYHEFVIPITSHFSFILDFRTSGMLLMWIALFLTLWSGVDYFVRFYISSKNTSA